MPLPRSSDQPVCFTCDGTQSPLNCAACARATLIIHRVEATRAHLNNLDLEKDATHIIEQSRANFGLHDTSSASQKAQLLAAKKARQYLAWEQLEELRTKIDRIELARKSLKRDTIAYRGRLEERKTAIAHRRSDVSASKNLLELHRASQLEPTRKSVKKISLRLDSINSQIVSARAYLCREAASLAGLKLRSLELRDGQTLQHFELNGLRVFDLREINSVEPHILTTSLANAARLTNLLSRYLHLRLPAEIIIPHRQYPSTTIYHLKASYRSTSDVLPRSAASASPSNSVRGSRLTDPKSEPSRPRPLYLDGRKLPLVAKEDPNMYSDFVEAIALLAWNVVWLCRTQGLIPGTNDWDDFCNIGKNMWLLLVENPSTATVGGSRRKSLIKSPQLGPTDARVPSLSSRPAVALGTNTHGTVHNFIGSDQNVSTPALSAKQWQEHSAMNLVDRLKTFLLSDMSGAEWEVVKEDEYWDASNGFDEQPVFINNRGHTKRIKSSARDVQNPGNAKSESEGTLDGAGDTMVEDAASREATGWMKLRSRPD